jgi:hypothetical protein
MESGDAESASWKELQSSFSKNLFRIIGASVESFFRRALIEALRLLLRNYAVAFDGLVRRTHSA